MSETLPQKDNINRKITVLKFGGSSVADADRMHEVSLIIKKYLNKGYRLSVIVSAMGNTTNDLLSLAHDVSSQFDGREIDQLLATGEQQSVALLGLLKKSRITTAAWEKDRPSEEGLWKQRVTNLFQRR